MMGWHRTRRQLRASTSPPRFTTVGACWASMLVGDGRPMSTRPVSTDGCSAMASRPRGRRHWNAPVCLARTPARSSAGSASDHNRGPTGARRRRVLRLLAIGVGDHTPMSARADHRYCPPADAARSRRRTSGPRKHSAGRQQQERYCAGCLSCRASAVRFAVPADGSAEGLPATVRLRATSLLDSRGPSQRSTPPCCPGPR